MNKSEAAVIVGGLSKPSKMPGYSYGLPRTTCKYKCNYCYAGKGHYNMSNVKKAHKRRLESLKDPRWSDAMIELLFNKKWFRWHDSGDVIDEDHALKLFKIAYKCTNTKFWLPTKKPEVIISASKILKKPENLTVRVSTRDVDTVISHSIFPVALVQNKKILKGFKCKAEFKFKNHKCNSCRACWNKKIPVVVYKFK